MSPDQRRLAHFRFVLDAEAREVANLRAQLVTAERERAAAEHELGSLRAAVAALTQSSSWRMTAPLRSVVAWLRGVRAGPAPDAPLRYRVERMAADESPGAGGEIVLVVSPVVPWPIRAGNEYRIARMLGWLKASGRQPVLVVAPLAGGMPAQAVFERLAHECPAFVWVDRDGSMRTGPGIEAGWLRALDGTPIEASSEIAPWRLAATERGHAHDALAGVFAALAREAAPRAAIVNYIWYSSLLEHAPEGVLRVIDTHDVYSQKLAKVIEQGVPVDDALSGPEEGALLDRADLVLAIHDEDRAALQAIVSRPVVVTAGVDVDVAAPGAARSGRRVLFVASDNALNVQGLRDFVRFAWDEVRRVVPDAELRVAGKVAAALEGPVPGVVAVGPIDDTAAEYAEARLVINPVRAGTGLKIKTVEAVAHGCPVVSWSSGVEGLPTALRPLCTVADSWPDFADAVIVALMRSTQEIDVAAIRDALAPKAVYAALDAALRD